MCRCLTCLASCLTCSHSLLFILTLFYVTHYFPPLYAGTVCCTNVMLRFLNYTCTISVLYMYYRYVYYTYNYMYNTCTILVLYMYYAAEYTNTCSVTQDDSEPHTTASTTACAGAGLLIEEHTTHYNTFSQPSHPVTKTTQLPIETVPFGKRDRKGNTHRLPRWVGTPFTSEI